MTDQQYFIAPSLELQQEWIDLWGDHAMLRATRWGWQQRDASVADELQKARDEELDACCEEMKSIPSPLGIPFGEMASNALRAARRPKPPSLAEQKQAILAEIHQLLAQISANNAGALAVAEPIRRALERLQELEGQSND